ncbi:unnamed protein product [Acanthosepion pharaonis]|uniref:Transmembrane protein n=1 Tax=Acanthosepion pharaonis TaxID=158019 RepID=A0A812DJN1_ACAPH|nr:unnamed protein product [Sepia pharaonis]
MNKCRRKSTISIEFFNVRGTVIRFLSFITPFFSLLWSPHSPPHTYTNHFLSDAGLTASANVITVRLLISSNEDVGGHPWRRLFSTGPSRMFLLKPHRRIQSNGASLVPSDPSLLTECHIASCFLRQQILSLSLFISFSVYLFLSLFRFLSLILSFSL